MKTEDSFPMFRQCAAAQWRGLGPEIQGHVDLSWALFGKFGYTRPYVPPTRPETAFVPLWWTEPTINGGNPLVLMAVKYD